MKLVKVEDAPVSLLVYYKITALCLCLFLCRFHSSVYGRLDTLWLYRVSLCYRLVFWRSWHICNHSLHNLLPNSSSYYAYIIQCHLKGQYSSIHDWRGWVVAVGSEELTLWWKDYYMWSKHHRYTFVHMPAFHRQLFWKRLHLNNKTAINSICIFFFSKTTTL